MDDKASMEMLHEAHRRAAKLVAELSKQKREMEVHPPDLPAEKLARGKMAMENALTAAERMLHNLDGALKIASVSSN